MRTSEPLSHPVPAGTDAGIIACMNVGRNERGHRARGADEMIRHTV
jgi:hypothetical protein